MRSRERCILIHVDGEPVWMNVSAPESLTGAADEREKEKRVTEFPIMDDLPRLGPFSIFEQAADAKDLACVRCDRPGPEHNEVARTIEGRSRRELFCPPRSPVPESVPWDLAAAAYIHYAKKFGPGQTLERLAQRGGFGWQEFACLLASHVPIPGHRDCRQSARRIVAAARVPVPTSAPPELGKIGEKP